MSRSNRDRFSLYWHHPSRDDADARRSRLGLALAPSGIALSDAGADAAGIYDLPGILLLSGASDLAAVGRISRHGQRRLIVAVDDNPEQADGGKSVSAGLSLDWRVLALGASEVLPWSQLLTQAECLAARLRRWRAIDEIIASPLIRDNLVGASPAWISLLRRIVEVARFTTASILLLGESGTGKEILARLIHTLDIRKDKRELIVLDCTTVMPELSGSEFFGHERSAFTNAHLARDGAFALAHRGTLFLDEVGELPPLQAQLLRVVQERTFKRLGSNAWQRTEFRLICATNRDLWNETKAGSFRRDLYYRLAGWVFRVPNLAERREDILPLARHFLASSVPSLAGTPISPSVAAWLQSRDYPGNIRDLRQLVLRIGARHVGDGPVGLADIPEDERAVAVPPPPGWPDAQFEEAIERAVALGLGLREISRAASDVAVRTALRSCGTLHEAARSLGVTDRALQLRQAQAKDAHVLH
jgi:transcriptional regulator with GAF, ATPase, and Fis domain